jgi:hypothetical protein
MDLSEMETRLKVLEDIEEIKKLQVRYVNSLLLANYDELLDCFSEDGVVDTHAGLAKSKKEREKLFKGSLAKLHIGQEGEFAVHPIITVEGDKAKASWLLYILWAQPRKLVPKPTILATEDAPDWQQAFYEMEYVREKKKWKISHLKIRNRLISPIQYQEK